MALALRVWKALSPSGKKAVKSAIKKSKRKGKKRTSRKRRY